MVIVWVAVGSSPLTRGTQYPLYYRLLHPGIILAYAGNTTLISRSSLDTQDHPRLRGEHVAASVVWMRNLGSSPLTRGTQGRHHDGPVAQGIIPAYAGNTPRWRTSRSCVRDHPRLRGEHAKRLYIGVSGSGSSPLTRGTHIGEGVRLSVRRIIPAYAGNTSFQSSRRSWRWDHPRLRGEHR